ncbi:MAG: nitrite/sulfite reductase [Sulfurovum sp.]|nr:nitrite/sulfite reductase [Sulfurovum sp.]
MKLNKIERLKAQESPFVYREKLFALDLHALDEDARFYLKNFGIYNIKLAPEKFMLRIRIAAGRIARSHFAALVQIAKAEGLELLLTARAQIELHGLHADNVLDVWQQVQEAGMTTLQTLTDNFRNIVTDPYDGMDESSRVEVYPLILQMQELFLDKPEWMGMIPRKFNTAICATESTSFHFYGNDLYFALAQKEGEWGFNVYLGGKNSEVAQPANVFVLPDEVPAMFNAVARTFLEHGLRQSRAKTRLFHLIETIGMEAFRKYVQGYYGTPLQAAGETRRYKVPVSHFTPLKDGTYGYTVQTCFGKLDLETAGSVSRFAEAEDAEIRLGVDQNLHLLGLKEKRVPFGGITGVSHITACAGSSYCALSLWDVKEETADLPLEKIEQHQIQVGFSGCLKGCGRHHHCDIGLVGLRTNLFGETQKAARVFLGGQYSEGSAPARLIFPSVPLKHLKVLLEKIIEAYEESGEKDFEAFTAHYINPHSTFFVMLWFLAQLYLKQPPRLEIATEEMLHAKLLVQKDFPRFEVDENYLESIKVMMHALWDDTATRTF